MSDRSETFSKRFSGTDNQEEQQQNETDTDTQSEAEVESNSTSESKVNPETGGEDLEAESGSNPEDEDEDENAEKSDDAHTCDECGKELGSRRGLQSHKGQVHSADSDDTVIETDDIVRLQLRVPQKTRAEFNGIAQSKLEIEMNSQGKGELFRDLSQPELQNAAVRVVVNNIDEWVDEIDSLYR